VLVARGNRTAFSMSAEVRAASAFSPDMPFFILR
jgi:hypothetical protein